MTTNKNPEPSVDGLMALVYRLEDSTIERETHKPRRPADDAYKAVRAYAERLAAQPAQQPDTNVHLAAGDAERTDGSEGLLRECFDFLNDSTVDIGPTDADERATDLLGRLEAHFYPASPSACTAPASPEPNGIESASVSQPAQPQGEPVAWRLEQLAKLLKSALRIPALPFPDPGAHSWQAYAQAVHSAYCAVRFKIIAAIEDVEKITTPPPPQAQPALSDEQKRAMHKVVVDAGGYRNGLLQAMWDAALASAPQADRALLRQAKEALQDLIGWIPNESAMARMGFHTEAPSKAHQKARETLAAIREHLGEQANG
jgi:hypothetical protein